MILSIVIPQYKEEDKDVKKLLSTIDLQLNVNWDEVEVIVVNDGSDVYLSEETLNSFTNIHPKYLKLEKNMGPGLCRQSGLDIAQGEYVTFCDADDLYHSVGVLSLYFEEIKNKHPDIIQTQWIEEIGTQDRGMLYLTHQFETTWMHGKVFKKEFLTSNNLRFSDKIWYHEDSYFLSNAFEITDNVVKNNAVTYVWTFRPDSITRRNNGAYSYEYMGRFIEAIGMSIDWLKDKRPEKIPAKIVQLSLYIYYVLQTNRWEKKYVDEIEGALKVQLLKYKNEFNSLGMDVYSQLELQEREKVKGCAFMATETFSQFIERITQ